MAKKLQILRGTTAQNDAYTGSIGELTMDTEKVEVRIHDGTTQGGKTIGSGGGASLPILTNIWSDHLLNDISWLRADTFSWQSGDVYKAAYNHLADDYDSSDFEEAVWGYNEGRHIDVYTKTGNPQIGTTVYDTDIGEEVGTVSALGDDYIDVAVYGGTERFYRARSFDKMSHSDTIGDITIRYALGADGHKICLPDQESNLVALYEATGVAWYYILDTENKQFKLPRSKHNKYADTVPVVGTGKSIGFTPVNKAFSGNNALYPNEGAIGTTNTVYQANTAAGLGLSTDPSRSQVFAQQAQDTDQYKYLYFYVGNYTQDAVEQTAGINAEMFNDLNAHRVVETQIPTADNGYTWYRKYADGWVEQGGYNSTVSGQVNIVLPIEMSSSVYNIQTHALIGNNVSDTNSVNRNAAKAYIRMPFSQTTTGFAFASTGDFGQIGTYWQVSGMSA